MKTSFLILFQTIKRRKTLYLKEHQISDGLTAQYYKVLEELLELSTNTMKELNETKAIPQT